MNVLVTGGAGYIGSVCVEDLLDHGHVVTVLDNLTEGHRAAVDPRAKFVNASLGDRAAVLGALHESRADAIMHFAAHALVSESMTHPTKYFRNNVADGLTLLDAAVEAGVKKFVFSSTCATYGLPEPALSGPLAQGRISEDCPQHPVNPYGESKWMFERMLAWFQRIHGLEFVGLRYFNAAGASARFGEHHRVETHLIPNVLQVALGQKPHCEIFGADYPTPDGTCIRDYIHVLDLAQAHRLALAPGQGGFFNLGNGSGYSVREVIQTCERISGRPIPTVLRPRRPGDPPSLIAAADKAVRELEWKPHFPKLEAIIDTAWRWHQAHPRGYTQ